MNDRPRFNREELLELARQINSRASAEEAIKVLRSYKQHLNEEAAECLLEFLSGDFRSLLQGPYRHISVNRAVSYISKGMDPSRALAMATADHELERTASYISGDFQSTESRS